MSKVWYGSLQNRLSERAVIGQPVPMIGMGATVFMYSDRHACTIVEVINLPGGRYRVGVQRDNAKVIKGSCMDGSAEYEYSPNAEAGINYFQTDKEGRWTEVYKSCETGRWKKASSGLAIGYRNEHYDPSF